MQAINRTNVLSAMFLFCAFLPIETFAGAAANMNLCIQVDTAMKGGSATFKNTASRCMVLNGNLPQTLPSLNVGLNCIDVGKVEEKGSDSHGGTCASETSHWTVSYAVSGSALSGSATLELERDAVHNQGSVRDAQSSTVLCTGQAVCNNTSQTWGHGTTPPMYLIFSPQSQK